MPILAYGIDIKSLIAMLAYGHGAKELECVSLKYGP